MTEDSMGSLKELQELDLQLEQIKSRIAEFDPLLEEVEEAALALEQEVTNLKGRLQEMKVEERRLEHSADDRRARSKKLQERLKSVRNLREEAAVRAEIDLVRMTLEGDEQEALTLLDQIRRMEDRLEEEEKALEEERASVEPRRLELLAEQARAKDELERLKSKRGEFTARVPTADLQNYERIKGGGRSVAVASLTPDGACGHCYGMVPLQLQNEIRRGVVSVACEACGVLLGAGAAEAGEADNGDADVVEADS
jgi:predicted  nucleic acid-binding Zn-ribbon protein